MVLNLVVDCRGLGVAPLVARMEQITAQLGQGLLRGSQPLHCVRGQSPSSEVFPCAELPEQVWPTFCLLASCSSTAWVVGTGI